MTVAALSQPLSTSRAVWRSGLFLLMTALLLPPYLLLFPFGRGPRGLVMRLWAAGSCLLTGLEVRIAGRPAERKPALLVANHVSYLDVPVLAACLDASFIAKSEVAGWPLFGMLAKISRTLFVERRPRAIPNQIEALSDRLKQGENLVLFPEGTSSDGTGVLPFKSGLFRAAYPGFGCPQPVVQPVSVAYGTEGNGAYAWHGDMVLAPHLWRVFCSEGTTVHVHFHEPVHPATFRSRKELARHCQAVVARGMTEIEAEEVEEQGQPVPAGI